MISPKKVIIEMQLVVAIMIADLVISQVSTTVSEAVLLNKPAILVNFENLAGAETYVDHAICLYARDREEPRSTIEKAFEPSVRATMGSAPAKFVYDCFCKTDGSCSASRQTAGSENELLT